MSYRPRKLRFGAFFAPFHNDRTNPSFAFERDFDLIEWMDKLAFDEAWIGEHHSGAYECIASPEVFIATAAVADYRPAQSAEAKIKRDGNAMTLELLPNPDILATVARQDAPPFTVGFAAETDDLAGNAQTKLERKGVDMIAANLVGGPDLGFNSEDNALTVFWRGGECDLERAPKTALARQLIGLVAERVEARSREN